MQVYHARLKEIEALGNDLPAEQCQDLIDFLNMRLDDQKDLTDVQLNALKNQALDKLIAQDVVPDRVGTMIADMYNDRRHDDLWRDYCVQHFALYYERMWPTGDAPERDPDFLAIREAYWRAARETDTGIAGTALLGLERISRLDARFDRRKVESYVLHYAVNPSTPTDTRTTAMHLCALTEQPSVLGSARSVADKEECIPLRMAAIATIGDIGSARDMAFLEGLVPKTRGYVRNAAKAALERLRKRHGSEG